MSAAVIILRRKKFIRRFAEQGATSPDRAIPFDAVGMRRWWIFDQMVSRGGVRPGRSRPFLHERGGGPGIPRGASTASPSRWRYPSRGVRDRRRRSAQPGFPVDLPGNRKSGLGRQADHRRRPAYVQAGTQSLAHVKSLDRQNHYVATNCFSPSRTSKTAKMTNSTASTHVAIR